MYLHCDLFSVSLERVNIIVDPFESHSLIQESIVAGRVVVPSRQETQSSQTIVDGDDYHLTPGCKLLSRELISRAVHELTVVDVEHYGK